MFSLGFYFCKFAIIYRRIQETDCTHIKIYCNKSMLSLKRIKETNSSEYDFIENLLTTSFPPDEYRNLHEQRDNTQHKECFHLMIVQDDNIPIGFISYWNFKDFCFVEHLATHPAMRNKGYGSMIMKKLQQIKETIILETELPTDELTRRRIKFYNRLNFEIFTQEYIQPAYKRESKELHMHLMFWNRNKKNPYFHAIRETIYKHVYSFVK